MAMIIPMIRTEFKETTIKIVLKKKNIPTKMSIKRKNAKEKEMKSVQNLLALAQINVRRKSKASKSRN